MHAALDWCKHALAYNIAGVITVQALIVTLMVPAILNEIVSRKRKITAWSLIQAVGNALKGSPLYKVPGFKQAIKIASTPEHLKLPPEPLELPPPAESTPPPPAAPGDGGAV